MTPGSGRFRDFATITRRYLDEGYFRGAAVRVERRGELLFEGAWGHALHTEGERVAMEPGFLFDLASVSKLFTTTAVLRLVTLGDLKLESSVTDLLAPADPILHARLRDSLEGVDLRALLCHSSGLHYWFPFYTRKGEAFESILADVLAEHPRAEAPVYSDLNFMLVGKIVESVTGLRLSDAVGELAFAPLGLGRTSYGTVWDGAAPGDVVATEFGNRIERRMVAELGLQFEGWRDEEVPFRGECDDGNCHYYFGGEAGHAGVFSDARDLCALGSLYLEGGRAGGEQFIAPALAAEARADHGGGRGLGFQIGPNYPRGGFGHTGFTGTYLHANDAAGLVIAVLTNRLHVPEPRNIDEYRREISEAALEI